MHFRHMISSVVLPLVAASCVTTRTFPMDGSLLRPADDAPVHFVTEAGSAAVSNGCRSPLLDPRDQTRIRMVRSGAVGATHHGDYSVPESRYGVRRGELLRIDCETGQALGIVAN